MFTDDLTWLTIDLKAIDKNINAVQKVASNKKIMAVVKSNAYGHGLFDVAVQALRSGAQILAVATCEEAVILRKKGIIQPVLVLGAVSSEELKVLIREKVSVVAYDETSLRRIIRTADILNKKVFVHIKVDTGLNRLGFEPKEAVLAIKKLVARSKRNIVLEGVYTHLAAVEEMEKSATRDQLLEFENFLARLGSITEDIPYVSSSASAAAVMLPDNTCNTIRLGIMMYGLWPSRELAHWAKNKRLKLRPALSWKTKLVQVKKVKAGEKIGYGMTYEAKKNMTIGIIPVGYYEGYVRALSNMGFALLKGEIVPVVGRVCMNMTILDISKRPLAKPGDTVTLIGRSQNKEITAQELAEWADTISYEIVTRLPEHLPRYLLK
jgi:alanine racemase